MLSVGTGRIHCTFTHTGAMLVFVTQKILCLHFVCAADILNCQCFIFCQCDTHWQTLNRWFNPLSSGQLTCVPSALQPHQRKSHCLDRLYAPCSQLDHSYCHSPRLFAAARSHAVHHGEPTGPLGRRVGRAQVLEQRLHTTFKQQALVHVLPPNGCNTLPCTLTHAM